MNFICNQDWDAMKGTANGRFCGICKKEVIDYTSADLNQLIIPEQTNKNELCGRFRIEQVDYTLIKTIEAPKQFRAITFISALLLSVSTKSMSAQTRDTTTTEQVEAKDTKKSELSDKNECEPHKAEDTQLDKVKKKKPFIRTEKRSYFWTRKFPFVKVVKHRRLMGRYRA